jgi:hypothetical protein
VAVTGQLHAAAAVPLGKKPLVPIEWDVGPNSWPGRSGEQKCLLWLPGVEP